MSEQEKTVEFVDATSGRKDGKRTNVIRNILNGNVLNRESVTSQIPYIFSWPWPLSTLPIGIGMKSWSKRCKRFRLR